MNMKDKVVGTIAGASIGYTASLVIALKYASASKPVPEAVILPTIVGGVIGFVVA